MRSLNILSDNVSNFASFLNKFIKMKVYTMSLVKLAINGCIIVNYGFEYLLKHLANTSCFLHSPLKYITAVIHREYLIC